MEKIKLFCRFVIDDSEVIAVFMRSSAGRRHNGTHMLRGCYVHNGQHGECVDSYARRKQATPVQYADLKKELEGLGYIITLV